MSENLVAAPTDDWLETTLGALCASGGGDIQTGPFGSQLHAADYVQVGIPSVMPQNIGDNVLLEEGIARITLADAERLSRYRLQAEDIIYSRRGDVERRALVTSGQNGWLCGTGCLRVRLGSAADPRFISYHLGHPKVREWVVRHAIGATMPNLNTSILSAVPLMLPPRPVQEAIASVLGVLDDKIAVNGRISATADTLTQEIFQAVHGNGGGMLRRGWCRGRLADICVTQYGYTASAQKAAVGPKFLRVKDINKRNWIEWETVPYCNISGADYQRYALCIGDVVVARMADPGKSAIIENNVDAIFASYLVRLKAPSLAHAYYVYSFLKSPEYIAYITQSRSGSVQASMNAKLIVSCELDIPPASLMGSYLEKILSLRQRLMKAVEETAALSALRDVLLPKLVSGEIRVRDAERVVEEAT